MMEDQPYEHPVLSLAEQKRVVILICSVLAFAVVNGTMFNVAIPDIAATFKLDPSEVSWVLTSYILVFAIGSLLYGKLADIYPIRRIYSIGITLFAIGAFLGFLAPNYPTLLAARLIQATGGAAIPAMAFLVPARFVQQNRGKVFAVISSTVAFASGVGPIIGGVIGGLLNWRFLFILSMLSALAIPLVLKWIPKEEQREGKIDWIGAFLISVLIATLLGFITTFNWWFLVVSGTFSILFVWRIINVLNPFIDPFLLKNRSYVSLIGTSFLGTTCLFGLIFVLPIMLRDLNALSTLEIGFILFPGAILSGFMGQVGGRLIETKGSPFVVTLALSLVTAGTFLISSFVGQTAYWLIPCLIVAYLGFPLIQSSTADLLTNQLSSKDVGVGMGLFNLFNFMAGAFASAIFGRLLDLQENSIQFNPLAAASPVNALYSNLYLGLSILAILSITLFKIGVRVKETN